MGNMHCVEKPCRCGSGLERYRLLDAKNIFIDYVCEKCEDKIKKKYRPEIFEDPDYDTFGENVEEDY